ncbi:PREDICTED: uncharacterized protein K02A2.6-like, partial [Myotis brandtii]|uniref:uncharacterized protein K02A2.6-like n=1 Tax=Myotis brandtii TaxID=109478 RepID=UPI0003BBFC00
CPKRPVPYAVIEQLDAELKRLEELGVLSPVTYSAWAAPIVVVRKANGSIRLCADFSTGLNNALETHQYPLPVPEDLFARLNGGKIFSKIDFSEAYLQIAVDDNCKELLTINTHRGLYRYNRLPFGVKCAPAIFQQIMDTMLSGIDFAMAYLDDIIIVSREIKDHKKHVEAVLQRIKSFGFHVHRDKCSFAMSSLTYLGSVIDCHGRRPDPAKISALETMPPPTNRSKLQSFLGMVNYYNQFVPQMYQLRAPLNELLKKDSEWNWSPECQKSFDDIKRILSSNLLLTHYDPKLPIIVAADASEYGIGAVLLHKFPDGKHKAVSHVSRSLEPAEKNYSQIEKEGLALVFALKKFHKMLQGRRFTLLTDHKPLLSIFGTKKGIPIHTANRLQRWATMLLGYDFELKFVNTTNFGHADALSRLIADHMNKLPNEELVISSISHDSEIKYIFESSVCHLPVTASLIKQETQKDEELMKVIDYLSNGWPTQLTEGYCQEFFKRRYALTLEDGCIMYYDRVVIPKALQTQVLRQFHEGHPGISRMKMLARSYAYWPLMDKHIEDMVKDCHECSMAAKMPVKSELQSWRIPQSCWSRVHIDFAGPIRDVHYLIIVDAYSKWPEVLPMRTITTHAVISNLRRIFSQFGIPEVIVSDNGPQFTSAEFTAFCAAQGINHMRTPAYHPQSNGQAERFVDTFKRALIKAQREVNVQQSIEKFLLAYRATPSRTIPDQKSPAELFLGRRLRLTLDAMKPTLAASERNVTMEKQFNRHHGAKRRSFQIGSSVFVRNFCNGSEQWLPGQIIERKGSVLYAVKMCPEQLSRPRRTTCETVIQNKYGDTRPGPVLQSED